MRIRRFNKKYPNGFLFTDPEEFRKAEESGEWVDSCLKVYDEEAYKKSAPKESKPSPVDRDDDVLANANSIGINNMASSPREPEAVKEPPQPEAPAPGLCKCGCGTETHGTFAPGHYAKWKAQGGIKHGDSSHDKPPDQGDSL